MMNCDVKLYDIFISKPSKMMNDIQSMFYDSFQAALNTRGMRPRSLGTTDYSNRAPLFGVLKIMQECKGMVILGMRQTHVLNSVTRDRTLEKEFYLPTAWNNLEACMGFALNLPMLIICEYGIGGGVFDKGVTDRFIHHINLNASSIEDTASKLVTKYFESQEFLQPFNEWYDEIILFDIKRRRRRR